MAIESHPRYTTMEQPWWANDMLILILALVSIAIIVVDIELDLSDTNVGLWWLLAVLDLTIIFFFVADLLEDYSRCIDKKWWLLHNGWEFAGFFPMILVGIPLLGGFGMLRFLRLVRAFSAIMRILGATRPAATQNVERKL